MDRRTARGNRLGLAVVGVLLVAGGGAALARGLGLLAGPLGLPAAQPLLNAAERSFAKDTSWFWYVVAAVAVIIAVLALRWLFVQARSGALRVLRVPGATGGAQAAGGRTRMPARAASRAVTDELSAHRSIARAGAVLTGSPSAPRLRLSVTADQDCDWPRVRDTLGGEALAHLRRALELDALPTRIHVHLSRTSIGREVR